MAGKAEEASNLETVTDYVEDKELDGSKMTEVLFWVFGLCLTLCSFVVFPGDVSLGGRYQR